MSQPFTSVIIPTYNRKRSLLRTLDSLAQQDYPMDRFEVIVVDDGGNDGTATVIQHRFPFALRYVHQENQGDARARNRGAQLAEGEILQFIDDDIVVEANFIAAIAHEHLRGDRLMVMGWLLPMPSSSPTIFEQITAAQHYKHDAVSGRLHFTEILSGILSIGREHYIALGMMQPVAKSGSSVWCDVEFSFRAHRQGFSLWRAANAIAYHDDYALRDLKVACKRAERASAVGAELLQRHPSLRYQIPMFRDKNPVEWRQDPPSLTLRKLLRQLASSRPAMQVMEQAVPLLECHATQSKLLVLLYRWVVSGYIFRGYRQGLREMEVQAHDARQ